MSRVPALSCNRAGGTGAGGPPPVSCRTRRRWPLGAATCRWWQYSSISRLQPKVGHSIWLTAGISPLAAVSWDIWSTEQLLTAMSRACPSGLRSTAPEVRTRLQAVLGERATAPDFDPDFEMEQRHSLR